MSLCKEKDRIDIYSLFLPIEVRDAFNRDFMRQVRDKKEDVFQSVGSQLVNKVPMSIVDDKTTGLKGRLDQFMEEKYIDNC